MTCYVVTFEISSPANLAKLVAELKSFRAYCPVNANCWAILSDNSATQIRDKLLTSVGSSDRIFIVRSGTEAAWSNSYGEDNNKWLKNHL